MIKFLADECVFGFTIKFLRDEGWDITTVQEIGLQGAKDIEVFNKAQELRAVIITRDLDFGDIRNFFSLIHHGIIVLRMSYKTAEEVHMVLNTMLKQVSEDEIFKAAHSLLRLPHKRMWIDYDEEADVLYISFRRPQKATDTEMMEDGILLRYKDGELVGLTILDVSKR